ncbi:O-methyl transferase B [Aspergillus spinulosporus]
MEEIIRRIQSFAETAEDHERKALFTAIRATLISLEKPDDAVERIAVSPLELCAGKMGVDLQVFRNLSSSDGPLTLDELTNTTGADRHLLARVLRCLSSMNMVDQLAPEIFSANNVTRALQSPKGENFVEMYYQVLMPLFYELPKYLGRTSYTDPTGSSRLPFHDAVKWEGDPFTYTDAFPEKGALADSHMQFCGNNLTNWENVFSLMDPKTPPDDILFVDVGGGLGHQCARLRAHYPNLKGRMIVQDRKRVIDARAPTQGVEKMVHDIFEPQPILGARVYYMRGVLHDWPDDKCQKVLQNIATAMGSRSTLLIDEYVLPEMNVGRYATGLDMLMLASLGAQERTRSQWVDLVESVGLKVTDIKPHREGEYASLIVAVKAA